MNTCRPQGTASDCKEARSDLRLAPNDNRGKEQEPEVTERRIYPEFWIGDEVHLRVRDDVSRGIVTRVTVQPGTLYSYWVTWDSASETCHYDFELEAVESLKPS